ncbi:MAG: flagellin, partial [Gammaproteobacteria bacterium]|nr:flagellin [Gammaproteobacteria bacterium]
PTGNNSQTVQVGGAFDLSAPAPGSLTEADSFAIGGLTYEFTTDATVAGSNIAVTVADGDSATLVAAAINTAINAQRALGTTTASATVTTDTVTVTNDLLGDEGLGYDETGVVGGGGTGALVEGVEGTGTDAAGTTAVDNKGTLVLSAPENFTVTGTSGQLTAGGLQGSSTLLSQVAAIDISTVAGANAAIAVVDGALSQVNSIRGGLGAIQNRFESTISNLAATSENISSARSRILDADFAAETAELTRTQILQQAGISVLSQANAQPQLVLALLQ